MTVKRSSIVIVFIFAISSLIFLNACQMGYIAKSAYYQADLMRRRVPLKYALENYDLNKEQRKKIELTIKLLDFMEQELKLDTEGNYSRYVHLNQKYVTYAVSAAYKDQLKAFTWNFPIVGKVPYKGYFRQNQAEEEEERLKAKGLDTHLRGVSAYSTLGWFEDPLLSSMLRMKEHHFINTLIHETIHANLYIKGESKFNERVASFLGQLGTEHYYRIQNRQDELTQVVQNEAHDELIFSDFISTEIKSLKQWYKDHQGANILQDREEQFTKMKQKFTQKILPQLRTKNYHWFAKKKLNNAFLLLLGLYNSDFSVLERLANHHHRNFHKVFLALKTLEDKADPEKALEIMVSQFETKAAKK